MRDERDQLDWRSLASVDDPHGSGSGEEGATLGVTPPGANAADGLSVEVVEDITPHLPSSEFDQSGRR